MVSKMLSFWLGVSLIPFLVIDNASARRQVLTIEQQAILQTTQKIYIQAIALTENGLVDPGPIHQAVADQLHSIGFRISPKKTTPYDVTVKVKCEEKKRWLRTSRTAQDMTRPGTPSRTWTGPACLLTYLINGQEASWEYEVRTDFKDAWTAAQKTSNKDSGQFALLHLGQALRKSDFPLILAAEWKQVDRLAPLLTSSLTNTEKKRQIIHLAQFVTSPTMMQALEKTISHPDLAPEATRALGHMGPKAIPILMHLLQNNASVAIRVAAADALGTLGAQTQRGDSQIIPTLISMLQTQELELQVKTEIVRTLGKVPNQQSVQPLEKIGLKAWTSRSTHPHMQDLREAVDWSLWQINAGAHTDE